MTTYVMPAPVWGGKGGKASLRDEMLSLIVELARSTKPPRYAGVRLASAAKAIEAIDAEQERRDRRDPKAMFLAIFNGDTKAALAWLSEHAEALREGLVKQLEEGQTEPAVTEYVLPRSESDVGPQAK